MLYKRIIKNIALIIVLAFLLHGCKVLNPSKMFETPKNYEYEGFNQEVKEYLIRPYDKLSVRMYTNDGISLIDVQKGGAAAANMSNVIPYPVDAEGFVKLPTLGKIKVEGMSIPETELMLEERYSKYYQKPYVLVSVTNKRVVMFTSGSTGGTVLEMENEKFTLVEALAQAGGIDDFSKAYQIKLLRGDLSDPKVYMYNISSVEDMKKANLVLQANDVIYVEKRPKYVARTLTEMLPYVTILNTLILVFVTVTSFQ